MYRRPLQGLFHWSTAQPPIRQPRPECSLSARLERRFAPPRFARRGDRLAHPGPRLAHYRWARSRATLDRSWSPPRWVRLARLLEGVAARAQVKREKAQPKRSETKWKTGAST